MKKALLCFLCLMVIGIKPVFASSDYQENANRLPYGKNYLDLRNIIRTEPNDLDMKIPIQVKPDTVYTLVMGHTYIGSDTFIQHEEPYFTLYNGHNDMDIDLTIDRDQQRWYHTFTTLGDTFMFENLPVMASVGYDIMLYEGTYADFDGFEYYKSYPDTIYEGVYLVDYDNPVSEADIKKTLYVLDNKDGTVGMTPILKSDAYTTRTDKTGNFIIEYSVTDRMTNTAIYKMHVQVVDINAPTVTGQFDYTFEAASVNLDVDDLLDGLVIHDNVDILDKASITILKDDFTPNITGLGLFNVDLSIKDKSGNETLQSLNVDIKDTKAPSIQGPDVLYTYLNDVPKTLEEIQSLYTAYDNYDGDLTSGIVVDLNGYKGDQAITYSIYIRSVDSSGNRSTRTVHLHIIDDVAPVFTGKEPVISLADLDMMSQQDIINWFSETMALSGIEVENVSILLNEYEHGRDLKQAYIYFEYDVDGIKHQTRALVEVGHSKPLNLYMISGGILSLSLIGLYIYKKRKS